MKANGTTDLNCEDMVFECELCGISFESLSHFQHHKIFDHGKIKDVHFPHQGYVYSSESSRPKNHNTGNGGKLKSYECGVCQTIFHILDDLLDHLEAHKNSRGRNAFNAIWGKVSESSTNTLQSKSRTNGRQRNASKPFGDVNDIKDGSNSSSLGKKSDRDDIKNAKESECIGEKKNSAKNPSKLSKNKSVPFKRKREKNSSENVAKRVKIDVKGKVKAAKVEELNTANDLKFKIRISGGEVKLKKDKPCHLCHRNYSNLQKLKRHLRVTHKILNTILCNVCCKNFSSIFNLRRHAHVHTIKKQFQCTKCSKQFSRKDGLKVHEMKVHDNATKSKNATSEKTKQEKSNGIARNKKNEGITSSPGKQVKSKTSLKN